MIHLADEPNPPWWQSLLGQGLGIGIIIAVAAVVNLLGSRLIKRAVQRWIATGHSREETMSDSPEETVELRGIIMSQRREQRAKAVGQLLRNAMTLLIWGTASLMILSRLGVNIAPLMASAGVVGVALGFGAQTLIKDYLSGFFMIVEDQYGVGDLVDVGPVVGNVEEVALRVTRIRDLSGVVWYVRNGEILRVANQSQGWTLAAAVIPVSYNTDLEVMRRIVSEVGDQMWADPETQAKMLGKPTFAGVDAVSGEAVYVRIAAKARASQQISLTRDLRERLKMACDKYGVVVPVLTRPLTYGPDGTPLPPGGAPGVGGAAGASPPPR